MPSSAEPAPAEDPETFLTLPGELRYEIDKVKGSRFFATARPAADAAAAERLVSDLRAEFPSASHHCWAYRLGAGGAAFRSSDDGEPGGSAGRPILAQMEGHAVTNAAMVVTRFFGGTKLGVGGLIRAYGAAAAALLDAAELKRVVITRQLEIEFPYECAGAIDGLLHAGDLRPSATDYGERVRYVLEVPTTACEGLLRELTERTGGRIRLL